MQKRRRNHLEEETKREGRRGKREMWITEALLYYVMYVHPLILCTRLYQTQTSSAAAAAAVTNNSNTDPTIAATADTTSSCMYAGAGTASTSVNSNGTSLAMSNFLQSFTRGAANSISDGGGSPSKKPSPDDTTNTNNQNQNQQQQSQNLVIAMCILWLTDLLDATLLSHLIAMRETYLLLRIAFAVFLLHPRVLGAVLLYDKFIVTRLDEYGDRIEQTVAEHVKDFTSHGTGHFAKGLMDKYGPGVLDGVTALVNSVKATLLNAQTTSGDENGGG